MSDASSGHDGVNPGIDHAAPAARRRLPFGLILAIALSAGVIGVAFVRSGMSRPSDEQLVRIHAVFPTDLPLDQAIERGRRESLPVVAIAGATWCPPCQAMKAQTLSDEAVLARVRDGAIGVYVDVDRDSAAAMRMGATMIPHSVVIVDGEIVAERTGPMSPADFVAWIDAAAG